MKAALNGIPHLNVLNGWWTEGHIEGLLSWPNGDLVHGKGDERDYSQDVTSL